MSSLPEACLKPSPIWYNTALDLFLPLLFRDSVRRRVVGKVCGVVFSCLSSRAVSISTTEDYNTDRFIQVLSRFVNRHGCPKVLYSNRGSQLIDASNELKDHVSKLDNTKVSTFAADIYIYITWIFSPAKAPWYMS